MLVTLEETKIILSISAWQLPLAIYSEQPTSALTRIFYNHFIFSSFIIPHTVTEPVTRKKANLPLLHVCSQKGEELQGPRQAGKQVQSMPATLPGFSDHPPFLPRIGLELMTHTSKPSTVSVFPGPKGPKQEFQKYEVYWCTSSQCVSFPTFHKPAILSRFPSFVCPVNIYSNFPVWISYPISWKSFASGRLLLILHIRI